MAALKDVATQAGLYSVAIAADAAQRADIALIANLIAPFLAVRDVSNDVQRIERVIIEAVYPPRARDDASVATPIDAATHDDLAAARAELEAEGRAGNDAAHASNEPELPSPPILPAPPAAEPPPRLATWAPSMDFRPTPDNVSWRMRDAFKTREMIQCPIPR